MTIRGNPTRLGHTHPCQQQSPNILLEHSASGPLQQDALPTAAHTRHCNCPVRLRDKAHNALMLLHSEVQSRSLTGPVGNDIGIQVSILALKEPCLVTGERHTNLYVAQLCLVPHASWELSQGTSKRTSSGHTKIVSGCCRMWAHCKRAETLLIELRTAHVLAMITAEEVLTDGSE